MALVIFVCLFKSPVGVIMSLHCLVFIFFNKKIVSQEFYLAYQGLNAVYVHWCVVKEIYVFIYIFSTYYLALTIVLRVLPFLYCNVLCNTIFAMIRVQYSYLYCMFAINIKVGG